MLLTVAPPVCVAYYSTKKSMKRTLAKSPKKQPTETIKPVGVCNDINFNNILNRRPASSASNADKNRGHTNFTNILNHRQASTASNADKNRGHRIDCLLCQITGNNDAEMGVEGDLTAVYSTEYITTGYLTARRTT